MSNMYDPIELVHKIQYLNSTCLEIGLSNNAMYLRGLLLDHSVAVSINYPGKQARNVVLALPSDSEGHHLRFGSSIMKSEFGRAVQFKNSFDVISFEPKTNLEDVPMYITYDDTKIRATIVEHQIVPYETFQDEAWLFQQECIWTQEEYRHKLLMSYMYHLNVRSFLSDSISIVKIYEKVQEALCHL